MPDKKAFSLMELVVVMIIIAVLAAIAVPNYFIMMQQGAAKTAENNLTTIYNAEKTNYLNTGSYCINTSTNPCNNLNNINTNLSLNITDPNNNNNDGYFTYICTQPVVGGFQCTATNISNNSFTLSVTNNPIVLPGGTGCAAGGGTPCNPICVDAANPNYCPAS